MCVRSWLVRKVWYSDSFSSFHGLEKGCEIASNLQPTRVNLCLWQVASISHNPFSTHKLINLSGKKKWDRCYFLDASTSVAFRKEDRFLLCLHQAKISKVCDSTVRRRTPTVAAVIKNGHSFHVSQATHILFIHVKWALISVIKNNFVSPPFDSLWEWCRSHSWCMQPALHRQLLLSWLAVVVRCTLCLHANKANLTEITASSFIWSSTSHMLCSALCVRTCNM